VTLPEHIDVTNADQVREELLMLINRGAGTLIADMTATLSCDHVGAEAVARAHKRAVVSGTQLRLVVTAEIVSRVLSIEGVDRLVSIYPSLEAAIARTTRPRRVARARRPQKGTIPRDGLGAAVITPTVLRELIDSLDDGLALTDDEGMLALINRPTNVMFGYEPGDLIGRPVETLIPVGLRASHRSHRAAYARAPTARPMGARARFVGLRKDGATFPVEITLSPVPATTGHFTLAVIRDITAARQRDDLIHLAQAPAAEQAHSGLKLRDSVLSNLLQVGLSLQAAIDLSDGVAAQHITEALSRLDDAIHEMQYDVFGTRTRQPPTHPLPDGSQ
jgi:anti-anti-sigma factor